MTRMLVTGGAGFAEYLEAARLGELPRSCVGPACAAGQLGWEARTGLVEGLRTTLRGLDSVS